MKVKEGKDKERSRKEGRKEGRKQGGKIKKGSNEGRTQARKNASTEECMMGRRHKRTRKDVTGCRERLRSHFLKGGNRDSGK